LDDKCSEIASDNSDNDDGMGPANRLLSRYKDIRDVIEPKAVGTDPEIEL